MGKEWGKLIGSFDIPIGKKIDFVVSQVFRILVYELIRSDFDFGAGCRRILNVVCGGGKEFRSDLVISLVVGGSRIDGEGGIGIKYFHLH